MDARTRQISSTFKTPEAGCVRVGPIGAIPALLDTYAQEEPEKILAEVGLDLALFEDPENSISFVKAGQLLKLCAKRTDLPHFGLLVGENSGPDALGKLSELAIHSPDAGTALHNMILHLCIHDRGGIPTLTTNHGLAMLGYTVYQPMQGGVSQVCMASMTICCNVMRSLCGETWAPARVLFTRSQPDDIHPYNSFFKVQPEFDSEVNALVFPERWLQTTIPGADPARYHELVEELTTIKSQVDVDLLEEIRSLLHPLLVSGNCSEEHLARLLSMHPRTLNRRLKAHETSFRDLVSGVRYEISKQLLAESRNSVIEISTILGYADASVFTRAFRRWSGMTPSAWRMQDRQ
jgi:AraC-like DNA-binding protein